MLPDDATPTVDCLIALAMAEHPGVSRSAQAEYYEAVHQELAPLARQLEREARKLRQQLRKLREDVLSVMPENWREDPDWVALADNQKLTQKVGAHDTATLRQQIRSAQIAAGEDAVTANLRSMGLLPNDLGNRRAAFGASVLTDGLCGNGSEVGAGNTAMKGKQ